MKPALSPCRGRAAAIFIPLCGLHKATVLPNVAKRGEESKALVIQDWFP